MDAGVETVLSLGLGDALSREGASDLDWRVFFGACCASSPQSSGARHRFRGLSISMCISNCIVAK
jgi:hypothetical protein